VLLLNRQLASLRYLRAFFVTHSTKVISRASI